MKNIYFREGFSCFPIKWRSTISHGRHTKRLLRHLQNLLGYPKHCSKQFREGNGFIDTIMYISRDIETSKNRHYCWCIMHYKALIMVLRYPKTFCWIIRHLLTIWELHWHFFKKLQNRILIAFILRVHKASATSSHIQ